MNLNLNQLKLLATTILDEQVKEEIILSYVKKGLLTHELDENGELTFPLVALAELLIEMRYLNLHLEGIVLSCERYCSDRTREKMIKILKPVREELWSQVVGQGIGQGFPSTDSDIPSLSG